MEIAVVFVLTWLASAVAGGFAGSRGMAIVSGAMLGLLFGPLGVIAALGLDERPQCYKCEGRLDGRGKVCQHCHTPLFWKTCGRPAEAKEHEPEPVFAPTPEPPKIQKPAIVPVKTKSVGGWG